MTLRHKDILTYMLVKIEFMDGKTGKYEVEIDYENRVIDVIERKKGDREIVGFFPFEAMRAVEFEKERV